ncbi:hypothetical protein, partial [Klebsiella pneumoniae]
GGFPGGLLLVLSRSRRKRRQCLTGGTDKGCYGKYLRVSGTKKAPDGSQSFDSETVTFSVRSDNQLPFDCLLLTVLMVVLRRERVVAVTGDLFSADCTSINARMGNAVSWIIS